MTVGEKSTELSDSYIYSQDGRRNICLKKYSDSHKRTNRNTCKIKGVRR